MFIEVTDSDTGLRTSLAVKVIQAVSETEDGKAYIEVEDDGDLHIEETYEDVMALLTYKSAVTAATTLFNTGGNQ